MLRKLNFTLLGIVIVLGIICLGFTLYYKQVDIASSNFIKVLEGTVNPTGGN